MSGTSDYAATFALIDLDGDGLITATALHSLMTTIGADVSDDFAARAIEAIDADGDGLVSLEELTAYLDNPS